MEYGPALKQRVLDGYDQGEATSKIARRLRVSPSWCRRVKQRRSEPPRKVGGSAPKLDAAARQKLLEWTQEQPDATLQELRARTERELGVRVSLGTMWSTLRRLGLTLKKKRCWPANSSGPTSPRPAPRSSPKP